MRKYPPWEERLWSGITVTKDNSCWEWNRSCENGYGRLGIAGKLFLAHRLVYTLVYGDPGKLNVLHKCDNPPCCRPDHLFAGSQKDNAIDMVSKNRNVNYKGELHGNSKLTENKVRVIRELYGNGKFNYQDLADIYGVHKTVIGDVINRTTWKHI